MESSLGVSRNAPIAVVGPVFLVVEFRVLRYPVGKAGMSEIEVEIVVGATTGVIDDQLTLQGPGVLDTRYVFEVKGPQVLPYSLIHFHLVTGKGRVDGVRQVMGAREEIAWNGRLSRRSPAELFTRALDNHSLADRIALAVEVVVALRSPVNRRLGARNRHLRDYRIRRSARLDRIARRATLTPRHSQTPCENAPWPGSRRLLERPPFPHFQRSQPPAAPVQHAGS